MYQSFEFNRAALLPRKANRADAAWPQVAPSRAKIFGLDIVDSRRQQVANQLVSRALADRQTNVAFVNAHCVNVAAHDRNYREALRQADMLLPDGAGMRIAARMCGAEYGENLNGTDLFPLICAEAARRGARIYLLGGQHGVAHGAASAMMQRFPGLKIAGTRHGYFAERDTARVIRDINASKADMVFVGFGVPLQECWLARHAASIDAPVQLAVGGLFDYYSGRIARAPHVVRKIGCEWMWRLGMEPRRLAQRYLVGNIAFLARAAVHALEQRAGFGLAAASKRAFDLMATMLGLMVLAPILAAIALAIKLEDGGPVFFTQIRIGKDGKPFRVWKFRSMAVNAEAVRAELEKHSERDSVCFKMRQDPRITRVGALLRRTSLDELPQLFNVVTGEMSLVGPRPALPQEVTAYWDRALRRLDAKPGITCIWQVSGRAEIPFSRQVEMDIDYVENNSILRDLGLLLSTVPAVVTGRGAY